MNSNPSPVSDRCHNCGAAPLKRALGYENLFRVTSDCKPWPPGGQMGLCEACGLLQAVTNKRWEDESRDIYTGYEIYHQSGGIEQLARLSATLDPAAFGAAIADFHLTNPIARASAVMAELSAIRKSAATRLAAE